MLLEERERQAPDLESDAAAGRRTGLRRKRRSHVLLNVVTVAVTVVFSYIALSDIDFHEVWRALRSCDWGWLVPALTPSASGSGAGVALALAVRSGAGALRRGRR